MTEACQEVCVCCCHGRCCGIVAQPSGSAEPHAASAGAHDVDEHFRTAPFEDNIPVMLGLTGVWNTTFLGYPSLAILPYTQALSKLAPHIQQVSKTYSASKLH